MAKIIKHIKINRSYEGGAAETAENLINDTKAQIESDTTISFFEKQEEVGKENMIVCVTFPEDIIKYSNNEIFSNNDVQEFIDIIQNGIKGIDCQCRIIIFAGTVQYKDDDDFAYNLSLVISSDEYFGWNKMYVGKDDLLFKSIKKNEIKKWCGLLSSNMKDYKYYYEKEDLTINRIEMNEEIENSVLYEHCVSKMIKSDYCSTDYPVYETDLNGMTVRFWLGIGDDITNGLLQAFFDDKKYSGMLENRIIVCLGNGFLKDVKGVPKDCYMLLNDKRNVIRNGTYTTGDGKNAGIKINDDIIVLEV